MSKSLKYVKDFQFPSDCGFTGSAGSQVVKGYARGGAAKTPAAPKSERKEMARVMRETSSERKGAGAAVKSVSRDESYNQAQVSQSDKPVRKAYPAYSNAPMLAMKNGGMIPSTGKLGVVDNKNPGETAKHTAPDLPKPKTMMKKGGMTPKMQAKVGKVMGEYKQGTLHSGSKTGPEVSNSKQALAIAMSEARAAGKRKK